MRIKPGIKHSLFYMCICERIAGEWSLEIMLVLHYNHIPLEEWEEQAYTHISPSSPREFHTPSASLQTTFSWRRREGW